MMKTTRVLMLALVLTLCGSSSPRAAQAQAVEPLAVLAAIQVVYTNAKKVWDGANQVVNFLNDKPSQIQQYTSLLKDQLYAQRTNAIAAKAASLVDRHITMEMNPDSANIQFLASQIIQDGATTLADIELIFATRSAENAHDLLAVYNLVGAVYIDAHRVAGFEPATIDRQIDRVLEKNLSLVGALEASPINFASSPIWLSERFGGAWVTIYENGCVVSSGDGNEEIREYVICRIADGNCNGWGGLCPAENLDLWALLAQAQQNVRDRFFSDPAVSVARTAIVQAFELGRNDVGGIHIVRP